MAKGKLGLLGKPEFQKYLRGLPTNRLAITAITDVESGKTHAVESRQVGDNPPDTHIISETEITGKE